MASKAIRLKRGLQNVYITVNQLFEAAFGPTPRDFKHKGLLGWRPLEPDSATPPIWAKSTTPVGIERPLFPSPGVKMFETDDLIVVEVELPAIEEESLYLEISGDLLIIRCTRVPAGAATSPSESLKKADRKVQRLIHLPVFASAGDVRARLEGQTVRIMIRKSNGLKHGE
jgi:HSP20 family molecular chaperone IbpA